MSGDFKLRIQLGGSFLFAWCVVFNQGCCVFIQYNLLNGCCKWIPMQPWTQVRDYSLPVLTCHIRLRIGISHVSISGILVHSKCYISHCFYFSDFFILFYDCFLVDRCLFCFIFAFVYMARDSSLSNQEPILTCLLSSWLIIKLYHY